ncbi:helix-turn-helix transcriptional regulator [Roseateles sp.]|uniref:helix-turn-helix transcriptional regulator n=1 Tax=Roseateles sp. TaxID=1971397 RepID=UPI0039EC5E13
MTTSFPKAPARVSLSTPVPTLPQTGFVRQAQVLSFIPISKSTLWRQVAVGAFPAPVKLTYRVTAWRAEDIRLWIENRSAAA